MIGVVSLLLPFSNYEVKIRRWEWLIELTEGSDTLDYKPFFKYCILKSFYTYFYGLYLCKTKFVFEKTELYFVFF